MIHLVMMKIFVLKWTHANPEHVQVLAPLLVMLLIIVILLEHVILHLVIAQIQRNLMMQLVMIIIFVLIWTHANPEYVLVQTQLFVLLLINVMSLEHVILHLVIAQTLQ